MISIFPPLTVLITYSESSAGIDPGNGALVAGESAASAFQTSFVREGHMTFRPQDITLRRTGIQADLGFTCFAFFLLHLDVYLAVDIKFITR